VNQVPIALGSLGQLLSPTASPRVIPHLYAAVDNQMVSNLTAAWTTALLDYPHPVDRFSSGIDILVPERPLDGPGRLIHSALHARKAHNWMHSPRDVAQLVLSSSVDREAAVNRSAFARVRAGDLKQLNLVLERQEAQPYAGCSRPRLSPILGRIETPREAGPFRRTRETLNRRQVRHS